MRFWAACFASAESGLRRWFRALQDYRTKNPPAAATEEKQNLLAPDADFRCEQDGADDH
jgi:hypothetical protein